MTYGTVTNFDDHATVRFERSIGATIDRLWHAISSGDELSRWLAAASLAGEVGGRVRIDFDEDQVVVGKITRYEPPHVLECTWGFTGEHDSVLRFELAEKGNATRFVLEHRLLPPDQAVGYGAGWHAYLDRLTAQVTGADPVDWEARFSEVLGTYAGA